MLDGTCFSKFRSNDNLVSMKKSTFGRTFFSLAEAVVELAKAGFDVTVAALCDYALNNLLQLSVLLSDPTLVRFGRLDASSPLSGFIALDREENEHAFSAKAAEEERPSAGPRYWEMVWLPPSSGPIVKSRFDWYLEDHDECPWSLVHLYYPVEPIIGVADLCLLGDERRVISDLRYQLGAGINHACYGIFVRTPDGRVCQLQEPFDEKSFEAREHRMTQELDVFAAAKNLSQEQADELRQWIEGERQARLRMMGKVSSLRDYMPTASLPKHALIGVRPEALSFLIQALENAEKPTEVTPADAKESKKAHRKLDGPDWEAHPDDPPAKSYWHVAARYLLRQAIAEKPSLVNQGPDARAAVVVQKLFEHGIGPHGNPDKKFDLGTVKNVLQRVDYRKPHVSASLR